MNLNAVIIDSDILSSDALVELLGEFRELVTIHANVKTAVEGVQQIKKYRPNLVFIEVQLSEGTAFEMLESFKRIEFEVVFISNEDCYALKALEYGGTDYLLKPLKMSDLSRAIEKVKNNIYRKKRAVYNKKMRQYMSVRNDRLALPTKNGYKLVPFNEIVRLQAEGSYVMIHMRNAKPQLVSKPLKYYAAELNHEVFFRVHRSHVVNIRYVTEYCKKDGGYLIMENGDKVEVASHKKESLLSQLL